MDTNRLIGLSLILAAGLLLAPLPATAACGGDQLTLNFEEIKSDCGPRPLPLTTHSLGHSLDHHVETHDGRYDSADVIATKVNLAQFEEMAGAVRRLVTRAERLTDPAEANDAFRAADATLNDLPIAQYLTIDDFYEENRNYAGVVVPFEILLNYLRDVGTPDDLVAAVEESGPGC